MSAQPAKKQAFRPRAAGRSDYAIIGDIIEPGTRCWIWAAAKAELLEWLAQNKGVEAVASRSRAKCSAGHRPRVSVYQGDIDQGLRIIPTGPSTNVILSRHFRKPIARQGACTRCCGWGAARLVAFPNFRPLARAAFHGW